MNINLADLFIKNNNLSGYKFLILNGLIYRKINLLVSYKRKDMIKFLINYDKDELKNMMFASVKYGSVELIKYLIKNGGNINVLRFRNQSPLDELLRYEYHIAKIIKEYGKLNKNVIYHSSHHYKSILKYIKSINAKRGCEILKTKCKKIKKLEYHHNIKVSLNSIYKNISKKLKLAKKEENSSFDYHKKERKARYVQLYKSENVKIPNLKMLYWNDKQIINNFNTTKENTILINDKTQKILSISQKIKSQYRINDNYLPYRIKIKILSYLMKLNDIFFIKKIANSYCNCDIKNNEIKKEKFNSGTIYFINKKSSKKGKILKFKNDFSMNIFETGSIIEFSYNKYENFKPKGITIP